MTDRHQFQLGVTIGIYMGAAVVGLLWWLL